MLKCCFCGFEWKPKVSNPRACPNCKRYFTKAKPIELTAVFEQTIVPEQKVVSE